MQRYSILFPGIFPKVLKYGQENGMAYFDMEYFDNCVTAHEFLITTEDTEKISTFNKTLIDTMHQMHKINIPSNPEAIYLYLHEEIERRLFDCHKNKTFIDFLEYKEIYFNEELVPSFMSQVENYYRSFGDYEKPIETFTHGNLTLENILYSPNKNRVIFIDPYEENVVDSTLAEYSQIYQSCNSKYELYNSYPAHIMNNHITIEIPDYLGLNYFHTLFTNYVKTTCTEKEYKIIKLLEISQFIRMLPFKMVVDENKMIFFYALASKLFYNLQKNEC